MLKYGTRQDLFDETKNFFIDLNITFNRRYIFLCRTKR